MALFTIGNEVAHHVGDARCPECAEDYPEPCPCGGLVHAAVSDEVDPEGNPVVLTRCDQCGRSEDDLDLV